MGAGGGRGSEGCTYSIIGVGGSSPFYYSGSALLLLRPADRNPYCGARLRFRIASFIT